jgi:hypothetical protein
VTDLRTKTQPAPHYRAWAKDSTTFSTHKISQVEHNFHEHPLMELGAIANLAKRLYATHQCRFIKPGTTETSGFIHNDKSPDGRTIEEVFRRIEEPGSWVALYDIQTDPEYAEFLDQVIASVRNLIDAEQPGTYRIAGFMFISAPPSVTPFHIDRENNFWLQIRGRKDMYVCDRTNRALISDAQADEFIVNGTQPEPRDHFLEHAIKISTKPGVGLYFPVTTPHMTRSNTDWVKEGDSVAISVGVVFYTHLTRRQAQIRAFNHFLRWKCRFSPAPLGKSALVDSIKAVLGRMLVKLRGKLTEYKVPPSFLY